MMVLAGIVGTFAAIASTASLALMVSNAPCFILTSVILIMIILPGDMRVRVTQIV
jgi:hypothetical protein